jgi:hypothetical protein
MLSKSTAFWNAFVSHATLPALSVQFWYIITLLPAGVLGVQKVANPALARRSNSNLDAWPGTVPFPFRGGLW